MTGLWFFANVVLPLVLVGMGAIAVVLHGWSSDKEDRKLPGE